MFAQNFIILVRKIPKMYAVFLTLLGSHKRPDDESAGSKHVANSTINSK
jgi:hypothetical protein